MKLFSHPLFLPIYSGLLTVGLAVTLLTGAAAPSARHLKVDELDVQRINLREPDGTLRMIISNTARLPGLYIDGKEYPHDRRAHHTAGMVFFDGEGTENGGLIFGGETADGIATGYGHLSFDRYRQDQVINLESSESSGIRYAGISFNDQPDWPIEDLLKHQKMVEALPKEQRETADAAFWEEHGKGSAKRVYLGRRKDASSALELRDPQNRVRLLARVAADGTPALEFLDEQGQVTERWPQRTSTTPSALP